MKRAMSIANIQSQRVRRIPFTGELREAFSCPQDRGVWFIWGGSGSGKSSFTMQLAREFAKYYQVFYNMIEESLSDADFIERTRYTNLQDVSENFTAGQFSYDELLDLLKRRRSPKVVVIDSAPYFFQNFDQYMYLRERFRSKIFVVTGHAQGQNPRTDLERSIMFDANQKVFVAGYLATCKGRTIGSNGGRYIIYEKGYQIITGSHENT